MSNHDLQAYLDFVVILARECGQVILEGSKSRYSSESRVLLKDGNPADLVTETDKKVENIIRVKLKERFPDHRFIGEETAASGEEYELTDLPTWIVDPIDGTCNFVHGFSFVAVSIGMTLNKEPVLGVVFNPFLNELFTAIKGKGAYLNQTTRLPLSYPHPPLPLPKTLSHCLIFTEYGADRKSSVIDKKVASVHNMVSKDRPKAVTAQGVRSTGSAVMNLCSIAKGCADVYWEVGCWEWDVTAGMVIVHESGGIVVNGEGPNDGPADILGRKFLAIRGCSPADGDDNSKQSQLRIVKQMWNVVEEISAQGNEHNPLRKKQTA